MIFLPLTVAEDDWAGWKILHGALGEQIELVGDDLFEPPRKSWRLNSLRKR
ncbi:hypothetical protein SLN03_004946 [Escherichia coli]|nr:hypothetical protein [Escherichia coli]